jgi:hypothetical protein
MIGRKFTKTNDVRICRACKQKVPLSERAATMTTEYVASVLRKQYTKGSPEEVAPFYSVRAHLKKALGSRYVPTGASYYETPFSISMDLSFRPSLDKASRAKIIYDFQTYFFDNTEVEIWGPWEKTSDGHWTLRITWLNPPPPTIL